MATLNPNTIQYTGGANQGTAGSFKIKPDAYYDKLLLTMLRQMEFSYAKYAVEKTLPRNFGDTINWRRFNKLATTKTPLTEGVTPDGQTISGKEVTAVIAQYGNVMYFTDIIDLQQLDRVRQEYTVELGFQAKETMDEIVRDTLVSEGSAFFAGAAAATTELTSLVTHRVKVDDFRKIVLGMKRGFIGGNRKAAGKYVALVAPEIMFSLFEDQKTRDYMDFGQNNGMFNDGMIVDMFGIRFEEVLNAPMTEVGENFAHDSIVIGEEAYAITKLEGQSLKVITKGLGSAGVEDPLDQRQSIGWKMTGFASKVLNPEAVVNYWALAVDADDAEVEAPNFNYATTVIGGGGGNGGEPAVPTKTVYLAGTEIAQVFNHFGYTHSRALQYNWIVDGVVANASIDPTGYGSNVVALEVPEDATIGDILSSKAFLVFGNHGVAGGTRNYDFYSNTGAQFLSGYDQVQRSKTGNEITGGMPGIPNNVPGFFAAYGAFQTELAQPIGDTAIDLVEFYDIDLNFYADYMYERPSYITASSVDTYGAQALYDFATLDTYGFQIMVGLGNFVDISQVTGVASFPEAFEGRSFRYIVTDDEMSDYTRGVFADGYNIYHPGVFLDYDPGVVYSGGFALAPDIAVFGTIASDFNWGNTEAWNTLRNGATWHLSNNTINTLDYVVPANGYVVIAPVALLAPGGFFASNSYKTYYFVDIADRQSRIA